MYGRLACKTRYRKSKGPQGKNRKRKSETSSGENPQTKVLEEKYSQTKAHIKVADRKCAHRKVDTAKFLPEKNLTDTKSEARAEKT